MFKWHSVWKEDYKFAVFAPMRDDVVTILWRKALWSSGLISQREIADVTRNYNVGSEVFVAFHRRYPGTPHLKILPTYPATRLTACT